MSSSLDLFSEGMQPASNPTNPPPSRPSALDMSSPASLLNPNLAGHWQSNQFTSPNTAVESNHTQWHQPSPQPDDTPISQNQQIWPVGSFAKRDHSQSYSKAEANFHQQATAFDGMSKVHNQTEYPSPPGVNNNIPGEPPQTKASAVDDLFSNVDDEEMPDFDAMDQEDHMFEMSGLGQHPHNPTPQNSNICLQMIPGIYQTPYHATLIGTRDFADPASHPSPTESQLVAEGFEFHNELPEEVQINRFNDKAFRKALREVQSDLPRKQQWYAWSKAKQMLSSEPDSATTTEQMEKNWGEPLKRQDQKEYQPGYSHETVVAPANYTSASQLEDGMWDPPAQPNSLSNTIHRRSGNEGDEDRHWIAQAPQANRSSSPASTGGFVVGQGDRNASQEAQDHGDWASKPVPIDQDRLRKHPIGKLISKVADQHRARRESEDEGAARKSQESLPSHQDLTAASRQNSNAGDCAASIVTAKKLAEIRSLREKLYKTDEEILFKLKEALMIKMVARREGSAHGFLSRLNGHPADTDVQEIGMQDNTEHGVRTSIQSPVLPKPSTNAQAPPLPPLPSTSHLDSSTSIHSADLLRPHTNTLLRRSPSPSPSLSRHLPPSISPNRRSPSPWIEHPGINRPDTPRPNRPTSPLRTGTSTGADIRQSVERSSPFSDRKRERESTPAYTNRSPSPSPASHLDISSTTQYNASPHHQPTDTKIIEHDTIMTDALSPPIPASQTSARPPHHHQQQQHHLPANSSPDPLSSPLHDGNTYTAPTTPCAPTTHHPNLNPPPIPASTPLRPSKTRRKSIGGQTPHPSSSNSTSTSTTKPKPNSKRNATSVQNASISKSRNATRRVTQIAQKAVRGPKSATATATATAIDAAEVAAAAAAAAAATTTPGSKVAQAVKKIEEGIKGVMVEGSPRRSARLIRKKE